MNFTPSEIKTLQENWKKSMEHEGEVANNCGCCTWDNPQTIDKGTGRLGNKTSRDHPDYSLIGIGQKIEMSPGNWTRLAVTQIPVRNHQFVIGWLDFMAYQPL